jgi:hypothetical protein
MPNWCNNTVTITGAAAKIQDLWNRAQGSHFYTNAATGETEETSGLLEAMAPIGEWDYDTAVQTWGTKWDINTEGLQLIDNEDGTATITGYADSAWSPPVDAFQTYANANEDVYLELKYFEPGMSFIGVWDSAGGDAYWEGVGELLNTTQDEDPVLYDLLEHFNVYDWYGDEEENLEIDLDGGISAVNE